MRPLLYSSSWIQKEWRLCKIECYYISSSVLLKRCTNKYKMQAIILSSLNHTQIKPLQSISLCNFAADFYSHLNLLLCYLHCVIWYSNFLPMPITFDLWYFLIVRDLFWWALMFVVKSLKFILFWIRLRELGQQKQ